MRRGASNRNCVEFFVSQWPIAKFDFDRKDRRRVTSCAAVRLSYFGLRFMLRRFARSAVCKCVEIVVRWRPTAKLRWDLLNRQYVKFAPGRVKFHFLGGETLMGRSKKFEIGDRRFVGVEKGDPFIRRWNKQCGALHSPATGAVYPKIGGDRYVKIHKFYFKPGVCMKPINHLQLSGKFAVCPCNHWWQSVVDVHCLCFWQKYNVYLVSDVKLCKETFPDKSEVDSFLLR